MPTVLIIDDNPAIITALEVLLSLHDIDTLGAETPEDGLAILSQQRVDLVLQDMNFTADTTSGDEGTDLFCEIRQGWPDIPIVLLTAWTDLETAVVLVKAGAADYLSKPWDDDRLLTTIRNLLDLHCTKAENRRLHAEHSLAMQKLAQDYDLHGLVYRSRAMHQLVSMACQVARADVPILITGPSGAGKGKLAQVIQANSKRHDQPYVAVNAGALPSELIEAELFGAEAGAYTGAGQARTGRFEAADGGTLFLDEIGNLSLAGQMKMLRVLESGKFERLGSNRTRHADVRIISATNADLKAEIEAGRFREDLYYRLNVIQLEVPPLAERRDDVLPLARAMLDEPYEFSNAAEQMLERHDWPGNVRELNNCVRRASLLCQGHTISPQDLGLTLDAVAEPSLPDRETLDRELLESALSDADGNVSAAAKSLGLSRQALYRRMEKFDLVRPS